MKPKESAPNLVTVFIENEDGVTEFFVKVLEEDNSFALQTVAARVASGRLRPVTGEQIASAFHLERWATSHPEVFSEGRVSSH